MDPGGGPLTARGRPVDPYGFKEREVMAAAGAPDEKRRGPAAAIAAAAAAAAGNPHAAAGQGNMAAAAPQFASMLRRLEQRLETDRRQVDSKLQKLERRVEEVACASSSMGRWAELQGYVDGLGETVQDLVRRFESLPNDFSTLSKNEAHVSVSSTAGTVGVSPAQREELRRHCEASMHRPLAELAAQAEESQRHLAADLERLREQVESASRNASRDCQLLGRRLEAAERHLEDMAATASCTDEVTMAAGSHAIRPAAVSSSEMSDYGGDGPSWPAETLHPQAAAIEELDQVADHCDDLAERADIAQEQVHELYGRLDVVERGLQDAQQGLSDLYEDQLVKEQVNEVGEQIMRLALRAQKVDSADSILVDKLQGEVNVLTEDIDTVLVRVGDVEQGLECMSKAFERVCVELASLQKGRANGGVAETAEAPQETSGEASRSAAEPASAAAGQPADTTAVGHSEAPIARRGVALTADSAFSDVSD
eukprot:TRINITY_DN11638_c0_g1_i1.p1 TRINITY_DN11638_c0_g1~~TRINITY_DN11638_c0_g1_i1.p1  ORF type:complete len:483 (+),score=133.84 TRINITY_DN11638_c0_g1_i1:86-1534(+)